MARLPLLALLLRVATCLPAQQPATDIALTTSVIHSGVKHLGINLSGQTFYDSGQMMRNLIFRNPGFEGETWQTILGCNFVRADACADSDEWGGWPPDFAKGATYEFISGSLKGTTGVVEASSKAASSAHQGVWVRFGGLKAPPRKGDYYILRMRLPGDASAGWWPNISGGGSLATEFHDLAPNSPGRQALRLNASNPGQSAAVISSFDTWEKRSFVRLNGTYRLSFRAKGTGGANQLALSIIRLATPRGNISYLERKVPLTREWKDYAFTFVAAEDATVTGPVRVAFTVEGSSALIDDASLTEPADKDNPTDFRNAVVRRLRELRPGVLRYMDNGANFGSGVDDLIAPPFARQRTGYGEGSILQEDIAIGLHEFLVLSQAIHTEPWFVIPAGISVDDTRHLIEYLAGAPTTPYGAKRAARGQVAPWTTVFPTLHLELGNETWNASSFAGEAMPEPVAYATRVSTIFAAARAAPGFQPSRFDLIMDGWSAVPWWNQQELAQNPHADTIDIAPYLFTQLNDASSPEAVFGPMLAEPEAVDSRPTGQIAQQVRVAAASGVKLAVYEVNLSTIQGSVGQDKVDAVVPSLAGGLAVAEHMLLMLRDQNLQLQCLFSLPEFQNGFTNSAKPAEHELAALWGSVVDMGGQTDRARPTFLAEALANSAIGDRMLRTIHTGTNPTWNQAKSRNADIELTGAHSLQSFAFTDGVDFSVIVFNLDRAATLPVTFSGPTRPRNLVHIARLTALSITDSNEDALKVGIVRQENKAFDPAKPYLLPPFSMTAFTWQLSGVELQAAK